MISDQSKYQIGNFENNELIGERYLSINELKEFNESSALLLKYRYTIELHNILIHNYNELIDYVEKESQIIEMAEYNIARVKARSFRIELNRLLLNYLSITKSYINYIETDTARTYGKNSKQTKSLKKTLSFCFDNSFSYRFLYKLRNYAQHIDLPIRDISLKLKRIEKDKLIHFLKINFDKDTLLNNYKEWGHIVKKDLENKENDLKVINLLYRHIEPINYIHRKITNIRKNEFEKAIIFLTNLSNDYRKKYKTLCVFRSSPIYENGKLTREKLKIQPLDLNLLDLITDQINNDA